MIAPAARRLIVMARKRKAAKKKPAKKAAKKSKSTKRLSAKPKSKVASSKPRRGSSRVSLRAVEPSSGSASSSLDPNRAGRLRFNNADESGRRRRIGDLQGISMRDRADSESVGELLEEGQTLEAEAVQGVEDALDADQGEIRTHEVPEDDVPEEYLDNDR
jgi:hypothetical protein